MSIEFDGAASYVYKNLPGNLLVPFSVSMWVRSTDTTNPQAVFSVGNSALSTEFFAIWLRGDVGGDPVTMRCVAITNSGTFDSVDGGGYVSGVWTNIVGIFASRTDRRVYQDGVLICTGTQDLLPEAVVQFAWGAQKYIITADTFLKGSMQNMGFWNTALTLPEVKMLAKGYSCRLVSPRSLLYGLDGIRGETIYKGIDPINTMQWVSTSFSSLAAPMLLPRRHPLVRSTIATSPPPPSTGAPGKRSNQLLLGVS